MLAAAQCMLSEGNVMCYMDEYSENLKTAVLLNTCIAAIVFVGADFLASMFGKGDPETRHLSAYILRVYACGLPFSTVSIVFQNFFQSMKKMKLVNIICVCQNLLFMVGFALLPAVFGKNAVWLLFPLAHLTTALLILGISIAHNRRIPRSMEELLMLDAHFGIPAGDRMDLSITSMEQVMGTAKMAESFCLSHGIDQRRSQACALAMEEMAGNIVRHGFGDGKRHSIEVRLSYKDDQLIPRSRETAGALSKASGGLQAIEEEMAALMVDNVFEGIDHVTEIRRQKLQMTISLLQNGPDENDPTSMAMWRMLQSEDMKPMVQAILNSMK